jgi:hypothetical protein
MKTGPQRMKETALYKTQAPCQVSVPRDDRGCIIPRNHMHRGWSQDKNERGCTVHRYLNGGWSPGGGCTVHRYLYRGCSPRNRKEAALYIVKAALYIVKAALYIVTVRRLVPRNWNEAGLYIGTCIEADPQGMKEVVVLFIRT